MRHEWIVGAFWGVYFATIAVGVLWLIMVLCRA